MCVVMFILGAIVPRSERFPTFWSIVLPLSSRLVYVCKVDVEIVRSKKCVFYGNVVLAALPLQLLDWPRSKRT